MFAIMSGPLGSGKTTAAVGMITEYLGSGRKVATNIDIDTANFKDMDLRCDIMRVPDVPTGKDLDAIGRGHELDHPDEEMNGLLILDEAALWLNSRNWNQAGRQEVIAWFVHARKRRWDVVVMVQHESVVDKSVREMFGEYSVEVMNFSKMPIPWVGWIGKLIRGRKYMLPKMHRAVWFYNGAGSRIKIDAENYSGKDVYHLFDTEQGFGEMERGTFSYLSPWHLKGRYQEVENEVGYLGWVKAAIRFPLYVYAEACCRLGLLRRHSGLYCSAVDRKRRRLGISGASDLQRWNVEALPAGLVSRITPSV